MEEIDFVFPYVDSSEPVWQTVYKNTRRRYNLSTAIDEVRFRKWNNLKYLFRGISKFMPYIRKIHMIVSNIEQVPSWLNTEKVNIILHEDIIPKEFLPTFNSTTIEMFLNNIPDLASYFIYGNDDTFITNYIEAEQLFDGGKIKRDVKSDSGTSSQFKKVEVATQNLIAEHFNKKINSKRFIKIPHTIAPLKKSTLEKVNELFYDKMYNSCTPFRKEKNYNQYIYSYYDYFNGDYIKSETTYKYYSINGSTIDNIVKDIKSKQYNTLCLNDTIVLDNTIFYNCRTKIIDAFETILPEKCKYEKEYIEETKEEKYTTFTISNNNKELIEKIKQLIEEDEKIDLVFPYVTSDDPNWQELYKQHLTGTGKDWATSIERFRDAGTLKYLFRAIEKNLPFINKVHMLVMSETQVPAWLDTEKVNIITHEQFIPKEFLPTFSSSAIETFLPNINVSEKFIYINDDLFPFKKLNKEYFFNNSIPSYLIEERAFKNTAPDDFLRLKAYNLINNIEQKEMVATTQHGPLCYRMSWIRELFDKNYETLYNSITKFREPKNYNQYVYAYYQYKNKRTENVKKNVIYLQPKETRMTKTLNINFSDYDFVCINDDSFLTSELWKKISNKLNNYFPNKSKYEKT